jgi:hypothetical protein
VPISESQYNLENFIHPFSGKYGNMDGVVHDNSTGKREVAVD